MTSSSEEYILSNHWNLCGVICKLVTLTNRKHCPLLPFIGFRCWFCWWSLPAIAASWFLQRPPTFRTVKVILARLFLFWFQEEFHSLFQAGLELTAIFLPQSLQFWGWRCEPPPPSSTFGKQNFLVWGPSFRVLALSFNVGVLRWECGIVFFKEWKRYVGYRCFLLFIFLP